MRRRRLLLGLVLLASLAAAAVLLWPRPAPPGVSLTTLSRLQPGMTETEVAAILGPPVADVTDQAPAGGPASIGRGRLLHYAGDRASANIEYDEDDRLVRIFPAVKTVTGLERVRLRLNWW
jgi:hypothetical protein